ncbi:beta-lactamase/transpeptidase-like protein [Phlyctochytrium arcticum]|nr:beta-lactamase/transpeptidase-like protein [Phlyctochytrium arcticum]
MLTPTSTVASTTDQSTKTELSSTEDKLDACVQKWVKKGNFSGGVLLARDQEILLRRAYGLASRELHVPCDPNHKFRIGSMTKQFVAAAALLMQEQGLLDLSKTVAEYSVPEFTPEHATRITLYQLLNHSSGIPCYVSLDGYHEQKALPNELAVVLKRIYGMPLDHDPGSRYKYSNTNYLLMVIIIENVLGYQIDKFMQANIFDPLGMKDSGFEVTDEVYDNYTSGYTVVDGKWKKGASIHMSHLRAVGGVYSTLDDMLKWRQGMVLGNLLSPASRKRMFEEPLIRAHPHIEPPMFYGCGLFRLEKPHGRISIAHQSAIDGFKGFAETYLDEKLTLIILANNQAFDYMQMHFELTAIAFGDPAPEEPTEKS